MLCYFTIRFLLNADFQANNCFCSLAFVYKQKVTQFFQYCIFHNMEKIMFLRIYVQFLALSFLLNILMGILA